MKMILSLILLTLSASTFANYQLSENAKKVTCYGEDNLVVTLSASRTTMRYEMEGESNGPQKITKIVKKGHNSVTYISEEFSLTLSDKGDSMLYQEDSEPTFFNKCE